MRRSFTYEELNAAYESFTARTVALCELATEMVGGQPASEEGVRAFVQHQLKLTGREAEQAVERILKEEVGQHEVPSEEGELKEELSYGVNVIRRDSYGPYLASHMPRACLSAAASRLGIWSDKRGSKGDMKEMGRAWAAGISLLNRDNVGNIYLIGPDGKPAETYFTRFSGRVPSPQGSVSIQHDSECVAPGTRFAFEFRFGTKRISMEDVRDIFALSMTIGLGSVKAHDRGKFRILELEYEDPQRDLWTKPDKKGLKKVDVPKPVIVDRATDGKA